MTFPYTWKALKDWKWMKSKAGSGEAFLTIFELLSNVYGQLFHIGFLIISIVGWLPPLLYRISFKATCVVYFPFIWVAERTLQSAPSVRLRLKEVTEGQLEKTGRKVSGLLLLLLLAKIGLAFGWADVSDLIAQFPSSLKKFVGSFVVPNIWPWWLCILWAAAALSVGLFFYSDAALRRLDASYRDAWSEQDVKDTVSTLSFFRASLAVVVMAYFFQRALISVICNYFAVVCSYRW
jgi:hypothetical protein